MVDPSKKDRAGTEKIEAIGKGPIFTQLSQVSLYITILLVIIGQWRIEEQDIRILYSLCMIIGSAVGSYGTRLTAFATKHRQDIANRPYRSWAYFILLMFGFFGLIS